MDRQSLLEGFIARHKPQAEFTIITPAGQALRFRGVQSATEFDAICKGAANTVATIRRAATQDLKKYLGESDRAWIFATCMAETMLGQHAESDLLLPNGDVAQTDKDRRRATLRGIGDESPPFNRNDFLEIAMNCGEVYWEIASAWEENQCRAKQEAEAEEIEEAKND